MVAMAAEAPGEKGAAARIRARALAGGRLRVLAAGPGREVAGGSVLWPPRGPLSGQDNRNSLVLSVPFLGTEALLMADADREVEEALAGSFLPRGGILKVGHHGSATSTGEEFVRALAPRLALVSCGGRFGLPNPEVLRRLQAAGAEVFVTSRDGAILVRGRGEALEARGTLSGRRIRWFP
jgi:competence protein ComEC